MEPDPDDPREAWGVLNPGGCRGPDGAFYLFPRLVAEGNFSRIGRARVVLDRAGDPRQVERLGVILEPETPYELSKLGGGVEDPRVTYLASLRLYVMAYTAYMAPRAHIALAISSDLIAWRRLGLLHYAMDPDVPDLNTVNNKDGLVFPDVVPDPQGRPSIAIIHRPMLPAAPNTPNDTPTENIWLSYVSLDAVSADLSCLTQVRGHRMLMAPEADWEALKLGGGAPPVRLPYGWLLLYHGVSQQQSAQGLRRVYSAGAAVLAPDDPGRVLYRSPRPILVPEAPYETQGIVPHVVFPTATDRREGDRIDVYYGAGDATIGVARLTVPAQLPHQR
jgi:predicted GH43/DUF377 family glycosyl hydrolase